MTLDNFVDKDPLHVVEEDAYISPVTGEIIGFVASTNYGDKRALISERYRYTDPKGRQHYYRKKGGYGYCLSDIQSIAKDGIKIIVIEEVDNDRVLVFGIRQYLNGDDYGQTVPREKHVGVSVEDRWDAYENYTIEKI